MVRPSNTPALQNPIYRTVLLVNSLGWVSLLGFLGGGAVWASTTPASTPAATTAIEAPGAPVSPTPSGPPPAVANPGVEALTTASPDVDRPRSAEIPGSNADVAPPATSTLSPSKVGVAPVTNDAYIDTTRYSLGATQRYEEAPPRAIASGLAPVSVGPVSLSAVGIQPGGTTASGQEYSTSGNEDNSFDLRQYYNRTVRPPGRLGNGNISLIFPLSIPAPITSLFGWRTHPITGDRRLHAGVDLGAPLGTPVLAAYAGRVVLADFLGGYGLAIVLEHNQGTQQTLYGHLSEIFVKPGETIKQGMTIGRVGSTGLSTGPHLHFEFRQQTEQGWVAMDPGAQLEYALAQLVKTLQTAQVPQQ